jgi:hypothetical protein
MSAQDNLNPQQFYHASEEGLGAGDTIYPNSGRRNWPQSKPGHAYFTDSVGAAGPWGDAVYTVQPTGPHSVDENYPKGTWDSETESPANSYQTRHPLKITGLARDAETNFAVQAPDLG